MMNKWMIRISYLFPTAMFVCAGLLMYLPVVMLSAVPKLAIPVFTAAAGILGAFWCIKSGFNMIDDIKGFKLGHKKLEEERKRLEQLKKDLK